jgi:hypothetical protein
VNRVVLRLLIKSAPMHHKHRAETKRLKMQNVIKHHSTIESGARLDLFISSKQFSGQAKIIMSFFTC